MGTTEMQRHKRMKTKTFTVAEAKKSLSKVIRHAECGDDVYITLAGKPVVKVVPLAAAKKRLPGRFEGEISWQPDAFDVLTDEEMTDLGFEWHSGAVTSEPRVRSRPTVLEAAEQSSPWPPIAARHPESQSQPCWSRATTAPAVSVLPARPLAGR